MYNCIRMEFRKCFHSHNFIISMATCVLLALSSASYCCQGYLNIHDALDQYCFENGHMVSNELFPVWTSYNYWIGGESETLAYSAFYTLLPLFAILPHSLSCLQEKIILCQPDGCACRPSALLSFQRDRMFFRSVYHDCYSTHLKFCCHGCFYSKHGPSNQLRNL